MPKVFTSDEERRAYNAEKSRRWRERNPVRASEVKAQYYASDKGRMQKRKEDAAFVLSGGRARCEAKRASQPVSEARKAARMRWAQANKIYFTAMRAYRRTLQKALDPCEFWVLQEAVGLARLREAVVGGKWHVDHIIPVSKGGDSRPNNIQVVPATWNRRKSNVTAERFIGA